MHTKRIGDATAAYFNARCLELGWIVSVPIGDCARYDCVLDRGLGMERIQIKTGRIRAGKIVFRVCSSTYHVPDTCKCKNMKLDYHGQIEAFGVYCPDNDTCYLVPIGMVGKTEAYLRIEPAKNGQSKNVKYAKDFII